MTTTKVPLGPASPSLAPYHSQLKAPVCVFSAAGGETQQKHEWCVEEKAGEEKKKWHPENTFIDHLALVPTTKQCPIQTAQKGLRDSLTANLGRLLLAQRLHFKWSKVCLEFMVSTNVNINTGAGVFFCVVCDAVNTKFSLYGIKYNIKIKRIKRNYKKIYTQKMKKKTIFWLQCSRVTSAKVC